MAARSGGASALLPDGRILVTGGAGAEGPLASVEIYEDGSFVEAAPMAIPRGSHTASALPDGRVLVAGGRTIDGQPTRIHINGQVIAIECINTSTKRMTFLVRTCEGCVYRVTVQDNGEGANATGPDTIKIEFVRSDSGATCPMVNTGEQPLTAGKIQWH